MPLQQSSTNSRFDFVRAIKRARHSNGSGSSLPSAPRTTMGLPSWYSGAALTWSRVRSSEILAFGWPGGGKCRALQSTAILRLPTPRKPPKSITAARTRPLWSTTTSTIRPIFSSAAPSTCRPRMPSTSWLFSTVTDGGSAVSVEEGSPVAGLGVSSEAADKATRAVNKAAASPNVISLLACIYVPMELHSDKPNGVGRFRSLVPTAERGLLPRFSALRLRGKHNRNADVAADPRRIERYGLAVAPHAQVDARGGKLQVAQHDLVQEFRQPRIAQPDLAVERVEF